MTQKSNQDKAYMRQEIKLIGKERNDLEHECKRLQMQVDKLQNAPKQMATVVHLSQENFELDSSRSQHRLLTEENDLL